MVRNGSDGSSTSGCTAALAAATAAWHAANGGEEGCPRGRERVEERDILRHDPEARPRARLLRGSDEDGVDGHLDVGAGHAGHVGPLAGTTSALVITSRFASASASALAAASFISLSDDEAVRPEGLQPQVATAPILSHKVPGMMIPPATRAPARRAASGFQAMCLWGGTSVANIPPVSRTSPAPR